MSMPLREVEEIYSALTAHAVPHYPCKLTIAAGSYCIAAVGAMLDGTMDIVAYQASPVPPAWPFARRAWSPTSPRHDLLAAAAMLLAEVKRMDDLVEGVPQSGPGH